MQYGRTWWGMQWLQSLDRIDFTNRLPRGKSYANKGMVSAIKITENIISAKVAGSRPKPYDVSVIVPPFYEAEQQILLEAIENNPLIMSQLLNRELPQELLGIAESKSIKIFPGSWQDIKLNCSCPDWAVPCKHLAAVIYIIANKIDQDPFLVFELHRVNLPALLSKYSIHFDSLKQEEIFSIKDCANTELNKKQSEPLPAPIDFSIVENLLSTLPLLYTSNPLFYDGDFKLLIQNLYKKLARNEPQHFLSLKNNKLEVEEDLRYCDYSVVANERGEINFTSANDKVEQNISLIQLLILFAKTEMKHLEKYSASFRYMYNCFKFCNILAERGAILPRLFNCGQEQFRLQWIPATINESVKEIFKNVLQWYPQSMMRVVIPAKIKKDIKIPKVKITKNKVECPPDIFCKPEEAQNLLCSLFITASIQNIDNSPAKKETQNDIKISSLFFSSQIQKFSTFSEKEIPNTIQLWLSRFYISKKNYEPVLKVSEMVNEDGFEMEVLIKDKTTTLQTLHGLESFLKNNNKNHFLALKDLQLLSHYIPGLNDTISSKGQHKMQYNAHKFSEVLTGILPAIRMFGISTLLPKSLQHLLKPQISVSLKAAAGKNKTYLSLTDIIDFDWKVSMGDQFISPQEFIDLTKKSSGLVKIRDQYVLLGQEEIEKIIKKLTAPAAPKAFTLLQTLLSEDYEGAAVKIDAGLKTKLKKILGDKEIDLPKGLKASLRQYQHRGYNWLYKNAQLGLGSLLADDMGLGKTIQVITALLRFKEEGKLKKAPALVIVPTTLLSNWKAEIEKFAPELKAFIYHGTGRKAVFNAYEIIITTYGIARTENLKISKQKWYCIIIDEAQNIKNTETAQTKAVKKIKADIKIALSGTPVENRLMEYWSILDFVIPGYLGNTNWFNHEFARPIELDQDKKKLEKFRNITAPFIMRRLKTDKTIISDLPDKIENNQYCNLSKEQASLYKSVTEDVLKEVEGADGINRRGLILKLLTMLKQICNHPAHFLKIKEDVKAELSGKMLLLMQLLETIYENNEKVLIFSQYKEMGTILSKVIHEHFGKKALQLHGGNSRKERDEMVHAFQTNKLNDTFILSLKAGGTGLNLTSGNHVIHYDLWWNPAVEAQATDRAFRIGQTKNVMVHRMITKGTLEEKIDVMLSSKKKLANMAVSGGEKWIGELSDKEIKQLVTMTT